MGRCSEVCGSLRYDTPLTVYTRACVPRVPVLVRASLPTQVYFVKLAAATTVTVLVSVLALLFIRGLLRWRQQRASTPESDDPTELKDEEAYTLRAPCGALPVAFSAQLVSGALVIPLLRTYLEAWDCSVRDSGEWTWDRDTTSDFNADHVNATLLAAGTLYEGDYPCWSPVHAALAVLALLAAATTVTLSLRLVAEGMSLDRVTTWLPFKAALVRTDTAPYRGPFTASFRKPLSDLISLAAKVRCCAGG